MPSILQLQRAATCGRYDPAAYLELCRALVAEGRLEYAAEIFDRWEREDPSNPAIPFHRGALLKGEAPARAPTEYLLHEFEAFADSFDVVLERLEYAVPTHFAERLARRLEPRPLAHVLDLGCGTGLCGSVARPYAELLVGLDLSAGMLERARLRGVYDHLIEGDLLEFVAERPGPFDVVLAGDCLIYFGALEAVFRGIRGVLRPGGLLLFSLELAPGDGYGLGPSGRFQHSRACVEAALEAGGFGSGELENVVLRLEVGEAVEGLVGVAVARAESAARAGQAQRKANRSGNATATNAAQAP
jgi:predicted TPR repeat methyltransferase